MIGLDVLFLTTALLIFNIAANQDFKKLDFIAPFIAPADGKCAPKLKRCDPDYIFYTDDGSCNNLQFPNFGQARYPFDRILPASFADEYDQPRLSVDGSPLPNTRKIRTTLLPNYEYRAKELNAIFYAFGQYSSHDASEHRPLQSTEKCCTEQGKPVDQMPYECRPTLMPEDDEFYSKWGVTCLDSKRSTNTRYLNCSLKPIRQINFQTSPLDLSVLYGSSEGRVNATRLFQHGLLKVDKSFATAFQEYPPISSGKENCPVGGLGDRTLPSRRCFFSGDNRINQNPEIFSMNIVFLRCHNLISKVLLKINRHWSDQLLFLYARRICVAMYQHIFFAEFVPVLIGSKAAKLYNLSPLTDGYSNGYNASISPQTFHEYTAVVGRSGHSTVRGIFQYRNRPRPVSYRLREKYFRLDFFLKKNVFLNIIQTYAFDQCNEQDKFITEELNNFLFPKPNLAYGNDMSALDMNRGREFAVQSYNRYREICGLPVLTRFEDLADKIVDAKDVAKFKLLYKNVDDIDLYVAGLLEKPYKDSTVGFTFTCLLGAQFQHWKFGDRKYFEFPTAKFSIPQLKIIRSISFAKIICLTNPQLEWIPQNAFKIKSDSNLAVQCSEMRRIDLTPWKEDK